MKLTEQEQELFKERVEGLQNIAEINDIQFRGAGTLAVSDLVLGFLAEQILDRRQQKEVECWKTIATEPEKDSHLICLWALGRVTRSHFVAVSWEEFSHFGHNDCITYWIEAP